MIISKPGMRVFEFEDKNRESVDQLVLDIPPGKNLYDYRGSGIEVEIVGKGHIIRNEESKRKGDELYYEFTDEFIGRKGEVLGHALFQRQSDQKIVTMSPSSFWVDIKKNSKDGLPCFHLDAMRILRSKKKRRRSLSGFFEFWGSKKRNR